METSVEIVRVEPCFTAKEQQALAGFLSAYRGLTREAYALDLRQDRLVVIDDGALAVLARWVDLRRGLGVSSKRRLFCTLAGGPLQPPYIRQLLPRLAGRAGIDKRVHAHGLRHAHAAELVEEGVPVHYIRDQLGHSSLAVTDRYLRRIAPGARMEAIRGREWRL
jgi:integrase